MLDLQGILLGNLEFRDYEPTKLSDLVSNLIIPGQEKRFWSPDENIVVVDTSFFVQGFFQENLWGEIAHGLMSDLNVTPVILPIVARELLNLKTTKRKDHYDYLVVGDSIDIDLFPKNLRLDLTVDDELSDRIINMWKSTSQKYRRYQSLKSTQATDEQYFQELPESIDPLVEPTLSPADIQIMGVVLLRSATGLPTMVLSGDSDITRTMNAFKYAGYPKIEVYGPSPPTESMLKSHIKDIEMLLTAEVIQKINSAEPNKQYLLISKNELIVGNQRRDLGFMVADEPINNGSIYSAPIVDPNEIDFDSIYSEFKLVAIPSEKSSGPLLQKIGVMIYNSRKHAFEDRTRLYKDLNVQKVLTDQNVPKREHGQYFQMFMKSPTMMVNVDVGYCRMTDGYMAINLPNMFQRVQELKQVVQK